MTMSDPIADMLTRIRNANTAKHDTVDVPSSKMKLAIAQILLDEGYIKKFDMVDDGSFKTIRITLKYGVDKNEKIADVQEVLEYLTAVMRGEQKEQVALFTGEGMQKLVQKDVSAKDRLKAAELIGKRYGLFTEKMELQGSTTVCIVDDIPEGNID